MGIMDWLSGGVVNAVKDIVDEFVTTDEEKLEYQLKRAELELKGKELETRLLEKVHETNIAEAKTGNWFIAGWRPFIGWVCGLGFAYTFVIAPFLHSLLTSFGLSFPLPEIDGWLLFNLAGAMLGLGTLRSYEKKWGVQNRH